MSPDIHPTAEVCLGSLLWPVAEVGSKKFGKRPEEATSAANCLKNVFKFVNSYRVHPRRL